MDEQADQKSLVDIESGYKEELAGIIQEHDLQEPDNKENNFEVGEHLMDMEELAEAINDIRDKVAGMDNDTKSSIQDTRQQLDDIYNNVLSIMATLSEITDLPQSLSKVNDNISSNVTNLQSALNQLNGSTEQCVEELQNAASVIPQKLLEDCNKQNKSALDAAVANFNAMNAASQKWIKQLGNRTDWATQIVIVSGIVTPILLLMIIYMLYRF